MDNASSLPSDDRTNPGDARPPSTTAQGQDPPSRVSTNNGHSDVLSPQPQAAPEPKVKQAQVCRFYASKAGCRAGDKCAYRHVSGQPKTPVTDVSRQASDVDGPTTRPRSEAQRRQKQLKPSSTQEQLDPREYQIGQVVRRFRPFRADLDDGVTTLKFSLSPTDPDFPFELDEGLKCVLEVPQNFPGHGGPRLVVQNSSMPLGFRINVEKGFEGLVHSSPGKTLLSLLNELDRNLESFLTATKATTVKLVANRTQPESTTDSSTTGQPDSKREPQVTSSTQVEPLFNLRSYFTTQQLAEAKAKRDQDVRQLESRLGWHNLFSKSEDGIAFNVSLTISKPERLPESLRPIKETALIVPELYPLEPCSIVLKGVEGVDAENVELAFEKHIVEQGTLPLLAHVNYLSQNIAKMAQQKHVKPQVSIENIREDRATDASQAQEAQEANDGGLFDADRPHLRLMDKVPPEWRQPQGNDQKENVESSDESSSEESAEDHEGGVDVPVVEAAVEKGVAVTLPNLDLKGIELLQITTISLEVRCDRCKVTVDVTDVKPTNTQSGNTATRTAACIKCTATFGISFHSTPVFAMSNRAGTLDLQGCTAVALLPSVFQSTCSTCSTPSTTNLTAVTGDSRFTNCRTCHSRMSFKMPELKFTQISTGTSGPALPDQKRVKEKLNIKSGRPLPQYGRCRHYSKSFRWFRFSCCNTVYPCDQCHDAAQKEDSNRAKAHPVERAERMLCGWCSREQRYDPERCRFCGNSLVKRAKGWYGKGFWEGGKGVRERALMHQNDSKKFKHKQEFWTGDKVPERIRRGPKGNNEPPEGWSERFK